MMFLLRLKQFCQKGSKGLQILARKLPKTLLFLKDTLIFLSRLIEKLEKDQLFWSASSLRSSILNVLWFRFNKNQLKVLEALNLYMYRPVISKF